MDKEVHVIFSDGDRHIYKEGYTKVSEEFLKESDINNHVIVTREYFKETERKVKILDKLKEMFETSANVNKKHGFYGAAKFYERYLDIIRGRGSDE